MPEAEKQPFDEWTVCELMGHQRAAGRLQEVEIAGAGMLRLDVPDAEGNTRYTRFYSPSAVYSISPVAAEVAIAVAQRIDAPPVTRWELPAGTVEAEPVWREPEDMVDVDDGPIDPFEDQ